MSSIFISYSRNDIELARKVVEALAGNDLDTWIDWQSIPKGEDWKNEIDRGIEEAEIFIFLMSPDSAKSEICNLEIAHAVINNKRIIPIVIRDTNIKEFVSEVSGKEISRRNWIFCRDQTDNFDNAIRDTIETIHTDFDWVKYHTKLQVRALEWERGNYERSLLYRGKELETAEFQFATNSSKDPIPTDLQHNFVLKSRQATDRQRRSVTSIAIVGIITLAGLAIFGFVQANNATNQAATAQANEASAQTAQANAEIQSFQRATAQAIAENNENLAKEKADIARAGELTSLSILTRETDFQNSLLLGVEAFQLFDTPQSRNNLLFNILEHPQLIGYLGWDTSDIPIYSLGDQGIVTSLDYSPDGAILASAFDNGTIIIWNVNTQKPLFDPIQHNFHLHEDWKGITFSSDGNLLISYSTYHVFVWYLSGKNNENLQSQSITGQQLGDTVTEIVSAISISTDGAKLALGDESGAVSIWDLETFQPVGQQLQTSSASITSLSFAPDSNILIAGSEDGVITVWDVSTRRVISSPLKGHFNSVTSLSFSPDATTLASGSQDGTVILWDAKEWEPIRQPIAGHGSTITSIRFDENGGNLHVGESDASYSQWNLETRELINQSSSNVLGNVSVVAFSPDGEHLAYSTDKNNIAVWDIFETTNAFAELHTVFDRSFLSELNSATIVEYSQDITSVAFADPGGNVWIWDIWTQQIKGKYSPESTSPIENLVFSSNGKFLVTEYNNGKIVLWDVNSKQVIGEQLVLDKYPETKVIISPDGKKIAWFGFEGMIILMFTESGEPVLKDDVVPAIPFTFNSTGTQLAASDGHHIYLWDPSTSEAIEYTEQENIFPISDIVFSHDGNMLASSSRENFITLWDLEKGEMKSRLQNKDIDNIGGLTISLDDNILASTIGSESFVLWDIKTGQVIGQPFYIHPYVISSMVFSSDGDLLVLDKQHDIIIHWDLNPKSWITKLCQRAGRNFTRSEWEQYFPDEEYRKTCEQWPAGE